MNNDTLYHKEMNSQEFYRNCQKAISVTQRLSLTTLKYSTELRPVIIKDPFHLITNVDKYEDLASRVIKNAYDTVKQNTSGEYMPSTGYSASKLTITKTNNHWGSICLTLPFKVGDLIEYYIEDSCDKLYISHIIHDGEDYKIANEENSLLDVTIIVREYQELQLEIFQHLFIETYCKEDN